MENKKKLLAAALVALAAAILLLNRNMVEKISQNKSLVFYITAGIIIVLILILSYPEKDHKDKHPEQQRWPPYQ